MRSYDKLSWAIFNNYGNRKKPGRISIVIDLDEEKIYPVPRKVEHLDFAKDKFLEHERIIPSHIDLEPNGCGLEKVVGIITGISGLEISGGVRHKKEDLEKAHAISWDFVKNGEIKIGDVKEDEVVYKYSVD